jgi:hypothetical protein
VEGGAAMSEWNVPKIREECLRMMGWTRKEQGHPDGDGVDVWWMRPDGRGSLCEGTMTGKAFIPDPTTSLDDALPLFKANDGTFIWLGLTEDGEEFEAQHGAWRQVNENPALAVCLLRLELAGHNLDDFRVKS